jgi:hypothetical protein
MLFSHAAFFAFTALPVLPVSPEWSLILSTKSLKERQLARGINELFTTTEVQYCVIEVAIEAEAITGGGFIAIEWIFDEGLSQNDVVEVVDVVDGVVAVDGVGDEATLYGIHELSISDNIDAYPPARL